MAEEQTNTVIRHLAYYSEENPNHPTTYDIGTDASKVTYSNTDLETYLNNLGPGGGGTPSYSFTTDNAFILTDLNNQTIKESENTISDFTTLQSTVGSLQGIIGNNNSGLVKIVGNNNSGLVKDVNDLKNQINNIKNNTNGIISSGIDKRLKEKILFQTGNPNTGTDDDNFDFIVKGFIKTPGKDKKTIEIGCKDRNLIGHFWTVTIKHTDGSVTNVYQEHGPIAFSDDPNDKEHQPSIVKSIGHVLGVGDKITIILRLNSPSNYQILNNNNLVSTITLERELKAQHFDTYSGDNLVTQGIPDYFNITHRLITPIPPRENCNIINKSLLDLIYPIGSIYMNYQNVNPAALFGGKWHRIRGRFLLGSYSGDFQTPNESIQKDKFDKEYIVEERGGSVYLGKHSHAFTYATRTINNGTGTAYKGVERNPLDVNKDPVTPNQAGITYQNTIDAGAGDTLSNMPPYFVVHIWRRTG